MNDLKNITTMNWLMMNELNQQLPIYSGSPETIIPNKSIKSTQVPIISTSRNMYHTPKIGTQIFNMDKWINMEDKTWPSPHGTLILCNLKMSFFVWTCLMCSVIFNWNKKLPARNGLGNTPFHHREWRYLKLYPNLIVFLNSVHWNIITNYNKFIILSSYSHFMNIYQS